MKRIYQMLLLFTLLLSCSFKVVNAKSAQDYGLATETVLPNSPSYVYKRIKEKAGMVFRLNSKAKFEYSKKLLEKRLSELVTFVDNKDTSVIVPASQRFSYQAGVTTNLASKLKNSPKQDVSILFEKYAKILAEQRDNYPANSASWLLIQQNIDTLKILIGEMK